MFSRLCLSLIALTIGLCETAWADPTRQIAQWHLNWTPSAQGAALRVLDELDRARPVRGGVVVHAEPSSNVARVTHHRRVMLPGGRVGWVTSAPPRFGFRYGARAHLRMLHVVGPGQRVEMGASFGVQQGDATSQTAHAWIRGAIIRPRVMRWGMISGTKRSDGNDRLSLSFGQQQALTPSRSLDLSVMAERQITPRIALSGVFVRFHGQIAWKSRPELGWRVGAYVDQFTANGDHNGYRGGGADLHVEWHTPTGQIWDATAAFEARRHSAKLPGLGVFRSERDARVGLGLRDPRVQIFGQTPRIGCQATATWSTIRFYEQRDIRCGMQFSFEF